GMATSARKAAEELWGPCLPAGEPEHLAKMLFRWENGPDKRPISGSQDHLGVCLPGISRLSYRDARRFEGVEVADVLRISLTPVKGKTVICGVEVIAEK
ncbi:MAG: hypothetical protein WBF17_12475, partial [Phycisphaerae bacterium]